MKDTKVASRYAKSLLDLALEQGKLEQVKNDMQTVYDSIKGSRDLELLFINPIIKTDKKTEVIKAIYGGNISELSFKFMVLITDKKRESYIHAISEEFLNQYKTHKKILTAVITTTFGLDSRLRNEVLDLIKKDTNQEIELIEKTNQDLIGGFILNIGGKRIDSSVSGKLAKLKKAFTENPYIKEN